MVGFQSGSHAVEAWCFPLLNSVCGAFACPSRGLENCFFVSKKRETILHDPKVQSTQAPPVPEKKAPTLTYTLWSSL